MKLTMCIPKILCYAFRWLHFGPRGPKNTWATIENSNDVPFWASYSIAPSFLSSKWENACPKALFAGFCLCHLGWLIIPSFGFMGRPDNKLPLRLDDNVFKAKQKRLELWLSADRSCIWNLQATFCILTYLSKATDRKPRQDSGGLSKCCPCLPPSLHCF